jgi:hypothetical protein
MDYPRLYFSLTEIRKRGWNDGLIKSAELKCAALINNMHRRDRPIKLFLIGDVERLEKTEQFQNFVAQRKEKRKKRDAKADIKFAKRVAKLKKEWLKLEEKIKESNQP